MGIQHNNNIKLIRRGAATNKISSASISTPPEPETASPTKSENKTSQKNKTSPGNSYFSKDILNQNFGSVGMINRIFSTRCSAAGAIGTFGKIKSAFEFSNPGKKVLNNAIPTDKEVDVYLSNLDKIRQFYSAGNTNGKVKVLTDQSTRNYRIEFDFGKYWVKIIATLNNASNKGIFMQIGTNQTGFSIAETSINPNKPVNVWTDKVYYKNKVDQNFSEIINFAALENPSLFISLLDLIDNN